MTILNTEDTQNAEKSFLLFVLFAVFLFHLRSEICIVTHQRMAYTSNGPSNGSSNFSSSSPRAWMNAQNSARGRR